MRTVTHLLHTHRLEYCEPHNAESCQWSHQGGLVVTSLGKWSVVASHTDKAHQTAGDNRLSVTLPRCEYINTYLNGTGVVSGQIPVVALAPFAWNNCVVMLVDVGLGVRDVAVIILHYLHVTVKRWHPWLIDVEEIIDIPHSLVPEE